MTTICFYEKGENLSVNVNGTKYNIRLNPSDLPITHTQGECGETIIENTHGTILFKSTDACTFMRLPIVNE